MTIKWKDIEYYNTIKILKDEPLVKYWDKNEQPGLSQFNTQYNKFIDIIKETKFNFFEIAFMWIIGDRKYCDMIYRKEGIYPIKIISISH